MSTNFPTNLDTFTNPTATDTLAVVSHSAQHTNINDAVSAIEAKVGKDGSAVTTSHDYKLSGVTGSDKAVSKTGTETLTNKTLTSPVINVTSDATGDMYYRNSGGALTRLPAGTDGQIIQYASGIPTVATNPSAQNASTTVAGIVELATSSEINAGTATGGSGAKLAMTPDGFASSKFSIAPKSGVSTFTPSGGSNTLTIAHGLGIIPRHVIASAFGASSTSLIYSEGYYDGSAQGNISGRTAGSGAVTSTVDTSYILNLTNASASSLGVATFDATNISIAFTNSNGGQSAYVRWTAFA